MLGVVRERDCRVTSQGRLFAMEEIFCILIIEVAVPVAPNSQGYPVSFESQGSMVGPTLAKSRSQLYRVFVTEII